MTTNLPPGSELLPALSAVEVLETAEFSTSAKVLSAVELRAIQLVLAEDPTVGEPIDHMPGLFQLAFGHHHVVYSFSQDLTKIFLLLVSTSPPTPPHPSGSKGYGAAKEAAINLSKGGLFVIGKKSVEWLISLLS